MDAQELYDKLSKRLDGIESKLDTANSNIMVVRNRPLDEIDQFLNQFFDETRDYLTRLLD